MKRVENTIDGKGLWFSGDEIDNIIFLQSGKMQIYLKCGLLLELKTDKEITWSPNTQLDVKLR